MLACGGERRVASDGCGLGMGVHWHRACDNWALCGAGDDHHPRKVSGKPRAASCHTTICTVFAFRIYQAPAFEMQHADFWAGFVALVRDGMWWSIGMKGEVTVAPRSVGAAASTRRYEQSRRYSDTRYSDIGHVGPDFEAKKSSRKERKRKERKERRRRASIDSPYGATDHTQSLLQAHRPQATRNLDTVAALFAHHGVQVHERAGGGSKSSDPIRTATFEPPHAGWTSAAPVKPQPASMAPPPPLQHTRPQLASQPFSVPALPVPYAHPHLASTQHPPPTVAAAPVANELEPATRAKFSNSTGTEMTAHPAAPAALQQRQGTMSASASAPSGLSKLQPAALSLVATATSAPSTDDDTITPRTRRIGNFARRQAGVGGYTASVAAAPVRLLPQGKRN